MPHLIIVPFLLAPHFIIPAALLYLIHLDQQETITRVRAGEWECFPIPCAPTPPPLPYRSNEIAQAHAHARSVIDTQPHATLTLEQMLKPRAKEIHRKIRARGLRQKYSRMRRYMCECPPNEMHMKFLRPARPFRTADFKSELQAVAMNFIQRMPASKHSVRILVDLRGNMSKPWNCHSPMRECVRNWTVQSAICYGAMFARQTYLLHRPKQTPFRTLSCTLPFKRELRKAVNDQWLNSLAREYTIKQFRNSVLPQIPRQRGYVCSKFARYLRDSLWYSYINQACADCRHTDMRQSPMRKYVKTYDIADKLVSCAFARAIDEYEMEISPMRRCAVEEQETIQHGLFHLRMNASTMKRAVESIYAQYYIQLCAARLTHRRAQMTSSPLRVFTRHNKDIIIHAVNQRKSRGYQRDCTLRALVEDFHKNYGRITRRMQVGTYKKEHNIPEVALEDGSIHTAMIVFPSNMQLVDKFLAESNLEGFTDRVYYQGKHHFRSYATALFVNKTVDEIIDTARTYKHISHLTQTDTMVWILSTNNKMTIPEDQQDLCTRRSEICFVRRDRCKFTESQYRQAHNKVRDYLKRLKNDKIQFAVSFIGSWLSNELVITLEAPMDVDVKPLYRELIHQVNLIKGFIFAKLIDNVRWVSLPPLSNDSTMVC